MNQLPSPRRRSVLAGAAAAALGAVGLPALGGAGRASAATGRLVGIAYSTWFPPTAWESNGGCTWGTPLLGAYDSANPAVIRQHGEWLADAGVDFILIDWSNDIDYPADPSRNDIRAIEDATAQVFATFAQMPSHPKIAILIGTSFAADYTNGRIQAKADQVYDTFVADPTVGPLYQRFRDKPLLIDYAGTPACFQDGLPPWDDQRFTVRHMTGFVSQQAALLDGSVSKYGYWSWEDRGPQTYPVVDGVPEAMVVTAGVRGDPDGWASADKREGRNNGQTFISKWDRAVAVSPQVVLVQSFNEWTGCPEHPGEEMSPEFSNDIEPSVELGRQYLDLLKQQVARFKAS
ncbi:hypothetical protein ABZ733_15045 [Streptomyces longwoodensis]|uniref:hypothetical protein n=1 Tax=Streptomyces longwoodensis TaxID=68231 RepID=UPI0033DC1C9D